MKSDLNADIRKKYPGPWKTGLRKFLGNTPSVIAAIIFLAIAVCCICAPIITDGDYLSFSTEAVDAKFSWEHPLGTDALGRDLLKRILFGGRETLRISFAALIYGALSGTVIGVIAGYYGGRADVFLMRIIEMLSSIPVILLVVAAECALGWGEGNYMYAIALNLIPSFAKLIRASVMDIAGSEYIEAARALGVGDLMIILRHVLRNIAAPFIIQLSAAAAESLLICTIVGYLGFGINPPTPEWGSLVATNYSLIRSKPGVALMPCVVIVICSLALNLIGNGLRDAFASESRSA